MAKKPVKRSKTKKKAPPMDLASRKEVKGSIMATRRKVRQPVGFST